MKKLFFLSAVCGLAVAASAVEVFSCNTVGVQRVSANVSEVSVGVPFTAIGGGAGTLADLLYFDTMATGDNVQICQSNKYGFYNVWTAVNIPGANITQFFSNSRTLDSKAGAYTLVTPTASEYVVNPGAGIKVTRSSTTSAVYVVGEYRQGQNSTTVKGNTQYYFVNPLTVGFSLDEKLTSANGVNQLFDRVYIDGTTYYYSKTGSGNQHWYYKEKVSGGSGSTINRYCSPVIPPGGAFIYNRGTSADLTFNW